MTFHLKTYPDSLRQLFVACTTEETNAAFDKALLQLQKSFSLAGYRKGKVPIEMIMHSNPPELMNLVSDILMRDSLTYIEEQKTPLYGQPRFNPMSGLSHNKEFLFSLVYEIYPSIIETPDFSKETFNYDACEMDSDFVEETMCRQIQLLETQTGTIKEFDLVKVEILNEDYIGTKPEASFDTTKLELLIGKKTGETTSIYFDDLSGYLPEFIGKVSNPLQVKIAEISRAKDWKKVTDQEIEEKTPFKTKEEYYEQSKIQFENLIIQFNNTKKAEVLAETIGAQLKAEIPKSLWLNNLRDLTTRIAEKEVIREDMALSDLTTNKEVLSKFAKIPLESIEGLAFIIWLEEIAKKDNITVEDQELEFHYYRYAQSKRLPMNDYKKHISKEEMISIKSDAIREKAITTLISTLSFKVSSKVPLSEALKTLNR